ncbi:MAG: tRNA (adenosine(37)-N6)-dimethylallyltransferase MiaA [Phycisphaeraceae bacterium]|nr:tRNA (adenosine(37)-N6)-dimethylallyltransferase MiaA [Phycisphaeraceae bacterium]
MPRLRPIVILGATASGKSALAVALAQRLGGEIIGADSMQVYRGMDAGTAKPSREMMNTVRHHMVDVVEPTEPFTVADWLAGAESVLGELQRNDVRAVVVGGTHLYVQGLLVGMFEGPPADAVFRQELAQLPGAELHRRLHQVDPDAAERIHVSDVRRMIRAIEVHHLTGIPISVHQQQWNEVQMNAVQQGSLAYRHQPILLGLHWETEAINRRINARVKSMFAPGSFGGSSGGNSGGSSGGRSTSPMASGASRGGTLDLVNEVRTLEAQGKLGLQAREALGYKQVLAHLAGRWSLDETMEQVKIMTRRYGKQQRTWMRRFRGVHWLSGEAPDLVDQALHVVTSEAMPG